MRRTVGPIAVVLVSMLAAASVPASAQRAAAGSPLGRTLAPFSFESGDGPVAFDPALGLRAGGGDAARPAALIVHVFQPDCLACRHEAEALAKLAGKTPAARVRVVLVSHKGIAEDVAAFAKAIAPPFPVLAGAGSAWALEWGRGDPTYIADRSGRIAYFQVGFDPGDVARWTAVIDDLAEGRPPRVTGPDRLALMAGATMPEIALPDLVSGEPCRLAVDGARLGVALPPDGTTRPVKAALGFFSRY